MTNKLREHLKISPDRLDAINEILLNPDMQVINEFLDVVAKYGTPEEINAKAEEAGKLENLMDKVKTIKPEYIKDLEWLIEQRDNDAFISIADYRKKVLGDKAEGMKFSDEFAVTLELSALQYFPWLISTAKRAIEKDMLMPGRFIRVRKMKEQEEMVIFPQLLLQCKSLEPVLLKPWTLKGQMAQISTLEARRRLRVILAG